MIIGWRPPFSQHKYDGVGLRPPLLIKQKQAVNLHIVEKITSKRRGVEVLLTEGHLSQTTDTRQYVFTHLRISHSLYARLEMIIEVVPCLYVNLKSLTLFIFLWILLQLAFSNPICNGLHIWNANDCIFHGYTYIGIAREAAYSFIDAFTCDCDIWVIILKIIDKEHPRTESFLDFIVMKPILWDFLFQSALACNRCCQDLI